MNRYQAGWAALISAGVALECAAVREGDKSKGNTLSEQVWSALQWGDDRAPHATTFARVFLVGGGVWLGLHLAFKM